jgi:hypothetical protein
MIMAECFLLSLKCLCDSYFKIILFFGSMTEHSIMFFHPSSLLADYFRLEKEKTSFCRDGAKATDHTLEYPARKYVK